jgi:uncharacterized RDD family membrane protein YckC
MSDHILDEDYKQYEEDQRLYRYAGFWTRVGAAMVDGIVLLPLSGLSFYILLSMKSLPLIIAVSLIYTVYKPLMEYQYGATLGKMAVGIKVINEDGGMLTPNQAIIRYSPWLIGNIVNILFLVEIFSLGAFGELEGFIEYTTFVQEHGSILSTLSSVASLILLVSVLGLLFNKQKQALHDKVAKTYCIHKN